MSSYAGSYVGVPAAYLCRSIEATCDEIRKSRHRLAALPLCRRHATAYHAVPMQSCQGLRCLWNYQGTDAWQDAGREGLHWARAVVNGVTTMEQQSIQGFLSVETKH